MIRTIPTLLLLLLLLPDAHARAAEELQPLHPGRYGEIGPGISVSAMQRASSADPEPRRSIPAAHKNMVRLTLPPLTAREESRARIVDAGSLNGGMYFSLAPPPLPGAIQPDNEYADIPGLIAPEILAMDQYNLSIPDTRPPSRFAALSGDTALPPPPTDTAETPGTRQFDEAMPLLDSLANDLVSPMRRFDTAEAGDGGVAAPFTSLVLPPATVAIEELHLPEPLTLPETPPAGEIIPLKDMKTAAAQPPRRTAGRR